MPPKSSSGPSSSTSNGEFTAENFSYLMKHMHDNHLEVLARVDSMHSKTIEILKQANEEYKASTELKLDCMNKEIYDLNLKCDNSVKEIHVLCKEVSDNVKYIKFLESELATARDEADDIQVNVNRPFLVVNNFKASPDKTDEESFTEYFAMKKCKVLILQ